MTQIMGVNYENEGLKQFFDNHTKEAKYYFVDETTNTVFVHDKLMNKIFEHKLVLDPMGDGLSIDKYSIYGKAPDGSYIRMYIKK